MNIKFFETQQFKRIKNFKIFKNPTRQDLSETLIAAYLDHYRPPNINNYI